MPASTTLYLGHRTVREHVDQALAEIIQPDEFLLAAFQGLARSGEKGTAKKGGFSFKDYLLVTDQRVIMWTRGVFSRGTDGFHYGDIASVEETTGLLLGEIILNVRGAKDRMTGMHKADVPVAARLIRDLIVTAKGGGMSPGTASAPQTIYLLRDDGGQDGPFHAAQVQQKLYAGAVTLDTLAWHEGLTEWQPLSQIVRLPSLPAPRTTTLPVAATREAVAPAETVLSVPPVSLGAAPSGPVQPRAPWYKRKGWQITFFLFFPYFQIPSMWYWKLFTQRTRIWVTVVGCFWFLYIRNFQADVEQQEAESRQNHTAAPAITTPSPVATLNPPGMVHTTPSLGSYHSSASVPADQTPTETFSIGWFGPKVTVRGDVATFQHTILADLTPKLAGFEIAKEVYGAATKHRGLTQIVVTCSMTVPGGFVDKYGKTVDGPLMMGSITVSNLDEVRRYEDEGAYALDTEMFYATEITGMNYSYLLSK